MGYVKSKCCFFLFRCFENQVYLVLFLSSMYFNVQCTVCRMSKLVNLEHKLMIDQGSGTAGWVRV